MGNKPVVKVKVNKEVFLAELKRCKCSIRKLGNAYNEIQRTDKTIRRYLNEGYMPSDLLDRIAKYLNIRPDLLSGEYYDKINLIEDSVLREMYLSIAVPKEYPVLSKAKSKIEYTTWFENTLVLNDISMEFFRTLPAKERVIFRQELDVAILRVIAKHFSKDALGKDISEYLDYYESSAEDIDPFSYYAKLEGINLPDPEFENEDSELLDDQFSKKWGV